MLCSRCPIIFLFLLLLNIWQPARAEVTAKGIYYTTVPFSPLVIGLNNTNLPLISVRINDTITARFLVDTGTNVLAFTDTFAKKLKLPLDKTNQAGYPDTIDGQTVHTTTLASFQVGRITIKNQVLVVLPPKKLAGLEKSVDGILGINFLSRFALLWDFPGHQLKFLAIGNFKTQDLQSLGFTENAMIPLQEKLPSGFWTLQGTFANASQEVKDTLVIDTGSVTTSISPLLGVSLNLKPVQKNMPKWGYTGIREINTASVDKLTLGLAVLTDFPIDYNSHVSDLTPPALGMDVLSRFSVLMDFPGKKMYLQPTLARLPTITIAPQPTLPTGR